MSEKQLEVVEEVKEEVVASGVGTYKFKKPTTIDGEVVTEITYDLTSLNGSSVRRVKGELSRRGYIVAANIIDEVFHAALFAEATGLTLDNVESFALVDYMEVANIVQVFWNGED